jgi:ABC-2 type transport system permease protein
MELPTVGFVSGHGERSIDVEGDRGYFRFSHERPFRFAIINQGFDIENITLDNPVPPHINVIVIADMRNAMTTAQEANLDEYVARGGNLLIAGDVKRQETMNPIVARFGANFRPGQIVHRSGAGLESLIERGLAKAQKTDSTAVTPVATNGMTAVSYSMGDNSVQQSYHFGGSNKEDNNQADFVQGNIPDSGAALTYGLDNMKMAEQVVTMPGCLAIDYTENRGFDVDVILASEHADTWNELETTDFIDDTVRINHILGESEESLTMGIAMSREVVGHIQRIIILGDSDCLSNGEISATRRGIKAANYNMIAAAFYWLSNDETPIDVRRPATTDNSLLTNTGKLKFTKFWMVWLFPALLFATSLIIWLRRKGR